MLQRPLALLRTSVRAMSGKPASEDERRVRSRGTPKKPHYKYTCIGRPDPMI
jgi:hypothetical protein